MLKPYRMSSIVITGPNNTQERIINELHSLKVLHIVEHSKSDLADIGKPLESANKLSGLLVKVRSLITALKLNSKEKDYEFKLKEDLLEVDSTTNKLNEEVNVILEELKKTEELISRNLNDVSTQELQILKDINIWIIVHYRMFQISH